MKPFLLNLVFSLGLFVSHIVFAGVHELKSNSIQPKLAKLEASFGGRLGFAAIATANNKSIEYRAFERFPMCSTAKLMVVAAILHASDRDLNLLNQKITYGQAEIEKSGYAPITEQYMAEGMSIRKLCIAAIEYSDNAAMNLLLKTLGGPEAVTGFARSLHDSTFRLDRWEPELNSAIPQDVRDTSTPHAMANSLKRLVLGDSLSLEKRKLLMTWLKNNTTGDAKIRAGVPKGWIVGDKTGSGGYGTNNDIAVLWPPHGFPIIMVIYTTQKEKEALKRDEFIAEVAGLALAELNGEMHIEKG